MYDSILAWGPTGSFLLIAVGIAVLFVGGEVLVRGASRLAIALRIPPLVVGLTVVAFCTSAPEFAVSMTAALNHKSDLAVGNVVGSNICNICFILGAAALIRPIAVSSPLIRREIPMMIGLSVLVYAFGISGGSGVFDLIVEGKYEGRILAWEGALLIAILAAYVLWTIYEIYLRPSQNEAYSHEVESGVVRSADEKNKCAGSGNLVVNLCCLIVGIAMLVAGSDLLVQGGVHVARSFGVSELIIGLTILAVGTSLPEFAVSLIAAFRGKPDLAVGNVVGSNIFNMLGVLGPAAMLSPGGLPVSAKALQFDIPFMILVSIFCITICVTGRRVSRGEGVFLLLCYAVYIGFLCFAEGAP